MLYKPYLKTFVTVARTGSFSKAAALLYVSASAVTQQINAMEKELNVTLFIRGHSGVTLSEAGRYLLPEAEDVIRRCDSVSHALQNISADTQEICVGTSMMEKCRLLYNLWVLFTQQDHSCTIQMVNIESADNIPDRTDMIESVNGGMPWAKGWEFMEVARIPFAFAVPVNHPLAKKKKILPQDLSGQTVYSINEGSSPDIQDMLRRLGGAGIRVKFHRGSGSSVLWEGAFNGWIEVVPACWEDILINMRTIEADWTGSMPYGIFSRPQPSPASARFLEFIRQTYHEGNPQGIVPIL